MEGIQLINVKAFEDTGMLQIAPITIFVGRNSCGKSSLVRMPVVLSQTMSSDYSVPLCLHDAHSDFDYGNFDDVVHNHKGDSFTVGYEMPFRLPNYYVNSFNWFGNTGAHFAYQGKAKLMVTFKKMQAKRNQYIGPSFVQLYFDNQLFCEFNLVADSPRTPYWKGEHNTITEYMTFDSGKLVPIEKKTTEIICEFNHFIPFTRDGNSPTTELAGKIMNSIAREMENTLKNLSYIGPFRSAPKRIYRGEDATHKSVGTLGEYTSSLLANFSERPDDRILQGINAWFQEAFDYQIAVKPVGNGFFQLHAINTITGEESNIMDVGYGISQVLPIVTQIVWSQHRGAPQKGKKLSYGDTHISVIEQPEIHLHPAAQAKLADMFASLAIYANKRYGGEKILVETHSEHLIRRLQVLIADPTTPLTKDMVKVYYVDRSPDGGSFVKEMKLTESGQFEEEWPSGFFDKAFELSRQLMKANAARKKAQSNAEN